MTISFIFKINCRMGLQGADNYNRLVSMTVNDSLLLLRLAMNSFNTEIHSDETASYEPTAADWQEYSEWVDSQESQTHTPELCSLKIQDSFRV